MPTTGPTTAAIVLLALINSITAKHSTYWCQPQSLAPFVPLETEFWYNPNFIYTTATNDTTTEIEFRAYASTFMVNQTISFFVNDDDCPLYTGGIMTVSADGVYINATISVQPGTDYIAMILPPGSMVSMIACPGGCTEDVCPMECSGNGVCNVYNRTCECFGGWSGSNCTVCQSSPCNGDVAPIVNNITPPTQYLNKKWYYVVGFSFGAALVLAIAGAVFHFKRERFVVSKGKGKIFEPLITPYQSAPSTPLLNVKDY